VPPVPVPAAPKQFDELPAMQVVTVPPLWLYEFPGKLDR
jgi:hypothetical protein